MNRSLFKELWFKMVHSGSRMNLFIGINIAVFLLIGIIHVLEVLGGNDGIISGWITAQLAMPAYLPAFLYKFWTPFTYMFTHTEFFHILFNMLWLYWMGRIFEDFMNARQFTFTYLAGGLAGAAIFILAYNLFPVFQSSLPAALILGASASVSAIVIATATLVPDYSIMLLFFGEVKLKYLALVFILMDILSIAGNNPGGSIAHLGGALLGFVYIKQLRRGTDWSKLFKRKQKLHVIKNVQTKSAGTATRLPDQDVIDKILDKISKSGYESLTRQEKEQLFKASNKE
ncbi:rhomboid family intramembrane serine protease [Rubrolithibacter danxiaensis]|uniref:rhomboid family intramembrane serine protease n=1 Tax=Rubrolithibacter danxiaensis TaxID=3390805 RepID=UPI003BF82637